MLARHLRLAPSVLGSIAISTQLLQCLWSFDRARSPQRECPPLASNDHQLWQTQWIASSMAFEVAWPVNSSRPLCEEP
jgi:hypothetical protein